MTNISFKACYSKDNLGKYLFGDADFLAASDLNSLNELVGTTDLDLKWADVGTLMMQNDQRIMITRSMDCFYERGLYKGNPQIYRSIKFPLIGSYGKVLGVQGISIPVSSRAMISLTKQQTACLKQLALGMTVRQIGDALGLSPKTVEHYLDAVKSKLHCESRSELILQAIERGLVGFM